MAARPFDEAIAESVQRGLDRSMATARRAEEAAAHEYSERKSPAPGRRLSLPAPLPPLPRPVLPPVAEEPALPLAAEVTALTPVPDSIGNLYFIGLYRNTGEATISLPRVELTLWSRDRQKLAAATGFAVRHTLAKGEMTPVKVLFTHAPAYAEVTAHADPQRERYGRPRPRLELGEARLLPDRYFGYRVTGTVKNPGPAAAQYVEIIALLYDEQERIAAMASRFIAPTVLPPGQQCPFAVAVTPVQGRPARVQLDYQASEAPPQAAPLR